MVYSRYGVRRVRRSTVHLCSLPCLTQAACPTSLVRVPVPAILSREGHQRSEPATEIRGRGGRGRGGLAAEDVGGRGGFGADRPPPPAPEPHSARRESTVDLPLLLAYFVTRAAPSVPSREFSDTSPPLGLELGRPPQRWFQTFKSLRRTLARLRLQPSARTRRMPRRQRMKT